MVVAVPESSDGITSRVPWYPFLFALYPLVRLYEQNMYEVSVSDVVVPLLVVMGVTAVGFGVLAVLLREPRRAALITAAVVLVVLYFGLAASVIESRVERPTMLLLLLSAGFIIVAVVVALCTGPRLGQITLGLNVLSLILVVMVSVPAAQGVATEFRAAGDPTNSVEPSALAEGAPDRDIYHLVLDRYGSEAALRAGKDIDNSGFVAWLRDKGFQVIDDAYANYTKTTMSLGSTLGMELLDGVAADLGPDSEDLAPVVRRVRQSPAGKFLQDQGYEYIHIGSWFKRTRNSQIADRSYNPEEDVSFGTTMYDLSVLPALAQRPDAADRFKRKHADSAAYQFDVLDTLTEEPGRKYVFAHILLPHLPYVYLEDGTFDPAEANYKTQLAYTNRRMQEFIEPLLELPEEERPIIVVQADEGPFPASLQKHEGRYDWAAASDKDVLTKFGILNAMYLPGPEGEAPLPGGLTAVNTYPELFRRYFGSELAYQPDRVMASIPKRPYDFLDITERLERIEREQAAAAP